MRRSAGTVVSPQWRRYLHRNQWRENPQGIQFRGSVAGEVRAACYSRLGHNIDAEGMSNAPCASDRWLLPVLGG
jgi:hypothetical protein